MTFADSQNILCYLDLSHRHLQKENEVAAFKSSPIFRNTKFAVSLTDNWVSFSESYYLITQHQADVLLRWLPAILSAKLRAGLTFSFCMTNKHLLTNSNFFHGFRKIKLNTFGESHLPLICSIIFCFINRLWLKMIFDDRCWHVHTGS